MYAFQRENYFSLKYSQYSQKEKKMNFEYFECARH